MSGTDRRKVAEARAKKPIVYRVNEIFYSVQAEGMNAGRPAVFVRFSGCNLDCPFCDTNHAPHTRMTRSDIEAAVQRLDPTGRAMVVITGGEPTMQLTEDEPMFKDRFVAMETNGILKPPSWVKHVTISPKTKLTVTQLGRAKEIKVLQGWFQEKELRRIETVAEANLIRLYIQPTADKAGRFDVKPAIEWAKANPNWTLSLQWHKLFNIQ